MNVTVDGEFVMKDYRGLYNTDTNGNLVSMLESAFPKGSIVKLKMTVELRGQAELCKDKTKYGNCGGVLNNGHCENESSHFVPEPEPEEVAPY